LTFPEGRHGGISPLQQATAPLIPQGLFGTKASTAPLQINQSPAFGVSSNNATEKDKSEVNLTDKIANMKDDKTIKQPVAVKP